MWNIQLYAMANYHPFNILYQLLMLASHKQKTFFGQEKKSMTRHREERKKDRRRTREKKNKPRGQRTISDEEKNGRVRRKVSRCTLIEWINSVWNFTLISFSPQLKFNCTGVSDFWIFGFFLFILGFSFANFFLFSFHNCVFIVMFLSLQRWIHSAVYSNRYFSFDRIKLRKKMVFVLCLEFV